jgi:hypothetical protein
MGPRENRPNRKAQVYNHDVSEAKMEILESGGSVFKSLFVFCGLTIGFAGVVPAHADILYNNLSNAPGSVLGTFPVNLSEGDSFSTGPSPISLIDVVLKLQGVHDSRSFTVSLYSDHNTVCAPGPSCTGGPLTLLDTIATVSDNSLSTTLTDVNFALATPYTLAANTRYWIIASSTNSGTQWSYTQDLTGTGVAGEFNTTFADQTPPGLLPNSSDFATYPGCINGSFGPVGPNACTPFQMEVVVTPEPSGLGIAALGLVGLVGWMRKRKYPI